MRRAIENSTKAFLLSALLVTAACASTPQGRELQAANAIEAANKSAKTALKFKIINPDEAQTVADITLAAETTLRRAVESRRADQDRAADALLDAVFEALVQVAEILEKNQ